ncbi:MAG: aminopeptidase [Polyangiaceae bacterium]|jgi:leucyl aminopeptidase|nr:aminopeptidase [Polyangiaceae bacterium]
MTTPPPVALPPLAAHPSLAQAVASGGHDALLCVGPGPLSQQIEFAPLKAALAQLERIDAALAGSRPAVACTHAPGLPGERLVVSLLDDWTAWEQDPRLIATAASAAVLRAIQAGARNPLLVLAAPTDPRFRRASEVALLGALSALWEPFELRASSQRPLRLAGLGVVSQGLDLDRLRAIELGRIVARDLCGTEPEVMAPEQMARYCEGRFQGTAVRVSVERDQDTLSRAYPLLAAVARASLPVERHHARVIRLEYTPEGPVERTLFFAGKGLTYDTGGADLKVDGHMAGMSRDKGGAAAVAGLLEVCAQRKPRGVRVIALLGAVRNSIGSNCFVTDEIIRARSGVRVRIGNTDAEGRLVLADLLAALREEAEQAPSPALFSVATLTGHAAVAFGPCTALVPNGHAARGGLADSLRNAADALGDPMEISRLRPEDYAFIAPKSAAEDLISCNSLPSSRTPRGHQFPAAFLDVASGLRALEKRGGLPFIHVDIAGATVINGNWSTGTPTGAPVLSFSEALGLL